MGEFKNIKTQAYIVDEKEAPFALRDIVLDEVLSDEVLVEIKYTGICHTDIVVQQGGLPVGGYPAILGHEGAGIVRHIGSGVDPASLKAGDTVILSFRTCKACEACRTRRCGACPHMTDFNFVRSRRDPDAKPLYSLPDGKPVHGQFFGQSSLSKMAIVDEQSVVKVDVDAKDLPYLAPLACGYLTGAGTILNALKPTSTSKVAVLGIGAVGMAAVLAAKSLGVAEIIAVDMVASKLELSSTLGATKTINTKDHPDFAARILELTGTGVDYILDATGVLKLLEGGVRALAHDGTLALVGVPPPGGKMQIDALDLLLSCKKVVGVIEGYSDPKKAIPELVELYRAGKFPVEGLARIYPASSLDKAIEDLHKGSIIKPIISWDE